MIRYDVLRHTTRWDTWESQGDESVLGWDGCVIAVRLRAEGHQVTVFFRSGCRRCFGFFGQDFGSRDRFVLRVGASRRDWQRQCFTRQFGMDTILYGTIGYGALYYDIIIFDNIYDMIWYNMIWYDMIWYDMIWYDMIWYDMIWYNMIWYNMIWYDVL